MDEEANEEVTEEATQEVDAEETDATETDTEKAEKLDPDKSLEKIRKLNSEAAALRKRTKDAEEKAKNAEGTGERVTALEAENMRLKVAVKLGGSLPDDLIERLRGTTEEEMLADAETLLAHFEKRKPPTQQSREKLRGGGDPTGTQAALIDSDPDKFAASIFKN